MAVPRNRVSNAHKRKRRSHHAKQPKQTQLCNNCQAVTMPHRVCPGCGFYKGKQMLGNKPAPSQPS